MNTAQTNKSSGASTKKKTPAAKRTSTPAAKSAASPKKQTPKRKPAARKNPESGILSKAADAVLGIVQGAAIGAASGAVEGALIAGVKAVGTPQKQSSSKKTASANAAKTPKRKSK